MNLQGSTEMINEAVFEIKKNERYFRLVITDSLGCKAYSSAFFLK